MADHTTMIIGGSGNNVLMEIGALYYLEEVGCISRNNRYVGVSIGSLISLLLICGYDVTSITDVLSSSTIISSSLLSLNINLEQIRDKIGILSQEPMKEKITSLIVAKFGMVPTLYQLYQSTGIEYVSVTFNLDDEITEHISYKNNPSLSCVDAALLSMTIPGLFFRMLYKNKTYIDASIHDPYPVLRYDDGDTTIIGITVLHTPLSTRSMKPLEYTSRIIQSLISSRQLEVEARCTTKVYTIRLYTLYEDGDITDNDRVNMFVQGYKTTKDNIQFIEEYSD